MPLSTLARLQSDRIFRRPRYFIDDGATMMMAGITQAISALNNPLSIYVRRKNLIEFVWVAITKRSFNYTHLIEKVVDMLYFPCNLSRLVVIFRFTM